jgi:hypothetical protein
MQIVMHPEGASHMGPTEVSGQTPLARASGQEDRRAGRDLAQPGRLPRRALDGLLGQQGVGSYPATARIPRRAGSSLGSGSCLPGRARAGGRDRWERHRLDGVRHPLPPKADEARVIKLALP